jgi:hypothetical protein
MKSNINSYFIKAILGFLMITTIVLMINCGGGSDSGGTSSDNGSPSDGNDHDDDDGGGGGNGNGDGSQFNMMALVVDASGDPIGNAFFGDIDLTDDAGIAIGEYDAQSDGWIGVQAFDHAIAYVKPEDFTSGITLAEARLTPYGSSQSLTNGDMASLQIGESNDPAIEVSLQADFEDDPVFACLAQIDPIDVETLFEPLSTDEDLFLQTALVLQAFNTKYEEVGFSGSGDVDIRIDDGGALQDPVLAFFDPEPGKWEVVGNACTREDAEHILCSSPRLFPLAGIFSADPVDYSNELLSRSTYGPFADADLELKYRWLCYQIKKRLRELEEILKNNPNYDLSNDAILKDLLDELAKEARALAKAHPNEKSKIRLGQTAGKAMRLGYLELGYALRAESIALAETIAKELLKDAKCRRARELLHAAEQIGMMGGDSDLIEKLKAQRKKNNEECDVWKGDIVFSFSVSSQDPAEYDLDSGDGDWKEKHAIYMVTNAETFELSGEDIVKLAFTKSLYERTSSEGCVSTNRNGNQTPHVLPLYFSGYYDGHTFALDDMELAEDAKPLMLDYYHDIWVYDHDRGCIRVQGFPSDLTFPHNTWLMHGFAPPDGSPPITLQEMLDEGHKRDTIIDKRYNIISGTQKVSNPIWDAGTYPVKDGRVTWFFMHIQDYISHQGSN